MYREHYGLVRLPFEMTPDPSFLYLGESHREGLATLVYGVRSGKGFVMLTGEVGTGKTTLLHALLGQLEADTASAFIFNPRLEVMDFFRVLFDEYGIDEKCETKAEYLLALNHFLIERLGRNQKTLLIIDEAQQLSPAMLEVVRLLSILETPVSCASGSCSATTCAPSIRRSSRPTSTSASPLRATRGRASSGARRAAPSTR